MCNGSRVVRGGVARKRGTGGKRRGARSPRSLADARGAHALGVYFALVGASVRSQLRYRASVFLDAGGYFLVFWAEFAAIWALFHRFGSLGGWSLHEVLICYGLAHLSFSAAEFLVRGFEHLVSLTRRGDYDRMLLRPVSTVVQLVGFEFALHRLGRLVQAGLVFSVGLSLVGSRVTVGGILLLGWGLVGGTALFCGLYIVQGAVGMKTLQNIEAFNILTNGGPEMAQFPMSIYPRPVRMLFTFLVPLAGTVYYPVVSFLARSSDAPAVAGYLGPVGGVVFLVLALLVFRVVEASYISTGS